MLVIELSIAVLTVFATRLSGKLIFADWAVPVSDGKDHECQRTARKVTNAEHTNSRAGEVQAEHVQDEKAGEDTRYEHNPSDAKHPVAMLNRFDLF